MSDYNHGKYKELGNTYGLPIHVVKAICESQFAFVKDTIAAGEDQPIRLQYLGKFEVPEGKRERVARKAAWAKKMRDEKNKQKK